MTETLAAHIRRAVYLLEWITAEKGDALVFWGTERLGTWRSLRPRWRILNHGIELRFQSPPHGCVCTEVSISTTAWGARIRMSLRRRIIPDELDICWDGEKTGEPASTASEVHCAVRSWLLESKPGGRILSAARYSDRSNSISGLYLRVHYRHHGQDILLLALAPEESDETAGSMLTQALLWLDWLSRKKKVLGTPLVYLLVPEGKTDVLSHRSTFLNANGILVEVWGYRVAEGGLWRVLPAELPPPLQEDRDFKWPLLESPRVSHPLARVLDLAPGLIRRYPRLREHDSLRIHGLEFAQVWGADRDRISFGVGSRRVDLLEDRLEELCCLVNEVLYFRRADSPDVRHPYYRMQSERWLESLILDDAQRLFPELSAGSVYSQIPVYLGENTGRVDILGIDSEGTLVVMELKVSEDPDLPLQALDYWGRVIVHNLRGDFQRRGYFGEKLLSRRHPKIYLVSPVFSFHDSTEKILRFLDPEIEVWKISLNEDWRRGVKVLSRRKLKGGCHFD